MVKQHPDLFYLLWLAVCVAAGFVLGMIAETKKSSRLARLGLWAMLALSVAALFAYPFFFAR